MSRLTAWWATSVEELAPIIDRWTLLSATLGKPLSAPLVRELARARPREIALEALGPRDASLVERLAVLWPWPGVRVVVSRRDTSSGLRLEATFDEWLSSRSGRYCTRFRRLYRGLLEAGGGVPMASTAADLAVDLEMLFEFHRLRWRGQSAWLTPHMESMLDGRSHKSEYCNDLEDVAWVELNP